MSQFYDQASLVMVPSGYKAGKVYSQKPLSTDGELTFTRNSNATRVNADGLVEKVRENLALYSQAFTNAVYGPKAGTFTDNYGTAPDGTQTACRWVSTNSDPYIYQPIALNGTYTASVWVKGVVGYSGKYMSIRIGAHANVVSLTNEWQRVSVTGTYSATINCGIEAPEGAAVGDEVLIWGFQVEQTDFGPTDYIPTTSAAVSVGPTANVPRLNYSTTSAGASACPSLLLEPQRTNLALYSESLNTAPNVVDGSTVTPNAYISPDGYQNADKFTETTVNDRHGFYQYTSVSAGAHTASIFTKKTGRRYIALTSDITGSTGTSYFDLETKSVVSAATGFTCSVQDYGNGWLRLIASFTAAAGSKYIIWGGSPNGTQYNYAGDTSISQTFWGYQLEAGSYASSYIGPTLGASVTKLADAFDTLTTPIETAFTDNTKGTIFFDLDNLNLPTGAHAVFRFGNSVSTLQFAFYFDSIGLGIYSYNGGQYIITTSNSTKKIAIRFDGTQIVGFSNGVKRTTYNAPASFNIDRVSSNHTASGSFVIKQFILFPTPLTDAECIELTTL